MLTQYLRDLEAQLEREEIRGALEKLKAAHGVFRRYPTPPDLRVLMQPGRGVFEDKDEVLRVLVHEVKRESTIYPLLNFMVWDSLARLFHQKRKKSPDVNPDEIFSRIQIDFFHTVLKYQLDRRPKKIDVNLTLDTRKKVSEWLEEEAAILGETDRLLLHQEPGLRPADLQEPNVFPEEMEAFLLDHAYRKVITGQQLDLLLDVKVYRRMTTKEWAGARKVPYSTTRSWIARVENVLHGLQNSLGASFSD